MLKVKTTENSRIKTIREVQAAKVVKRPDSAKELIKKDKEDCD